ncbi:MAG: putative two-component sensor histidine kinase [Chlamydiales bacterium]|jgi:signal transduction histidine kinase|nr:putative two-component sensor histidine kinase [Chlamydiales bacterium]
MHLAALTELQNATDAVTNSINLAESFANLTKAFNLCSQHTKRLERQYKELQTQFEIVNKQLEESNRKLSQKVIKLDTVTRYLDCLLNHMEQGILFIRIDGTVTTYNHASEQLLNIPPKDILSKSFWGIFADDFLGFSLKDALKSKKNTSPNVVKIYTQKAELREWEITTTFIMESGYYDQGLLVLIRDVTEYHRLLALANRHDRMKELGEMAAALAHEIRNPLGGIEGFASLLYRDLTDRPELQQMGKYIIDGTRTLNHLVSQVLHYARPIQLNRLHVNLVVLISDLIALLKADVTVPTGINFSICAMQRQVYALVDVELLKSAILNLLFNAVQAIDTGVGSVTVEIKQDQQHTYILTKDTGLGIPQENLEKIFSPFFTTKVQGNGFGLAEVHKIIQMHEGTIEVSSRLNEGTTFTITLPQGYANESILSLKES